jgi:hypothetical protein
MWHLSRKYYILNKKKDKGYGESGIGEELSRVALSHNRKHRQKKNI